MGIYHELPWYISETKRQRRAKVHLLTGHAPYHPQIPGSPGSPSWPRSQLVKSQLANVANVSIYLEIRVYDWYLDLHLALFSADSSFHLDLRSFWLFMLTWTRKCAFVSWRTGIYAFFPGIYAYVPGKYAHIFGFKMHQVQKCQKWCNYAHVEKNRSNSKTFANEHLFVLFRGYRYELMYHELAKSCIMYLSYQMITCLWLLIRLKGKF